MGFLIFIVVIFIVFVGGGWLIGSSVGSALDKMLGSKEDKPTYIDKSVHHHYHTTVHNHEHKNISIIDEATKKKIFELKESKNEK